MLAGLGVFVTFGPVFAAKPPTWQSQDFLIALVILAWLAGAVGVMWRRRWAWWISLAAWGFWVVYWARVFVAVSTAIRAGKSHDPTDGYGYALITAAFCSVVAFSFLTGLLLLRRECCALPPASDLHKEKGRE